MITHSKLSHVSSVLLGLCSLSLGLGCNQPDPPGYETGADDTEGEDESETGSEGDGEGDGGDGDGDGDNDDASMDTDDEGTTADMPDEGDTEQENPYAYTLYPLADGATWTYIDTNLSGQVLGMEVVEATQIEWEGETAWMLVDSPNNSGEYTEAILIRDGDLVMRVHKEIMTQDTILEIVDYDPGFPRARDTWTELDFSEEIAYERTETDGQGLNPDLEPRAHIYTVLGVDEEVTVPAGTFDCVKIERVRSAGTNIGERVVFWFAFGVGKVREERLAESRIEELASVSIPGAVELP